MYKAFAQERESVLQLATVLCLLKFILEVYGSSTKSRMSQDAKSMTNTHANLAWELRKKYDLT